MDTEKVTRLEVIDHSTNPKIGYGRTVIFFDPKKKVELSVQDDGRTLKAFVSDREPSMALDDLIDDLED